MKELAYNQFVKSKLLPLEVADSYDYKVFTVLQHELVAGISRDAAK
jgi:hypothetical protein